MANYNDIIDMYLQGKANETISIKLNVSRLHVKSAIFEYNKQYEETVEDRILQAKHMEQECIRRAEAESESKFYDKKLNSYITLFSQFNALK